MGDSGVVGGLVFFTGEALAGMTFRKEAISDAMRVWMCDVGIEKDPMARPPRAWQACRRRTKVGAVRLDKTDGRMSAKAGTKVLG